MGTSASETELVHRDRFILQFWQLRKHGTRVGRCRANTLAPDGQTGNDAGNIYFALRVSNNTGQTLDSFTLSYTGEQWRDSGVSTAETMTLAYLRLPRRIALMLLFLVTHRTWST